MLELNVTDIGQIFSDPIVLQFTAGPVDDPGSFTLISVEDECETITIKDVKIMDNILTFLEDGVLVNLGNEYYETDIDSQTYFTYSSSDAIYLFSFGAKEDVIGLRKVTCDCVNKWLD